MNKACEVVQDLLSLYVEDLASAGSCEFIEEHLNSCKNCRDVLEQTRKAVATPIETDLSTLSNLKRGLRKRTIFPVLLTVFFALTIFAGLMVCAVVPVWIPADEAIVAVEEMDDEQIRVKAADCVCGIVSYNNSFCFEKRRLDWFYSETMKKVREENSHYFYFQLEEGESLWYSGYQTGDDDVLVWGDGMSPAHLGMEKHAVKTLIYIFLVSTVSAAVLLLIGIILRNNLFGRIILLSGVFALCCSAACLFVTDGYLLSKAMAGTLLRYNRLPQQLIAIAVMTCLSYLSVLFSWQTIKVYRK